MSLTVQFNAAVKAVLTGSGDLGTPNAEIALSGQILLANGSGVDQAQKIFADARSLAASATENLDLAGALTDPLGATLTFATVKGIFIKAGAANPGNLTFGAHATAAFVGPFADATDALTVRPGELLPLFAPGTGYTVTATTADMLKVAAAATAGTYTYEIVIVGT